MEGNEQRAQLISHALPLFAKNGLHGVGVREIARAARCNVSMISYYFGSKFGLYEAVLREVFSDMLQVAEAVRQGIPPQETFIAYLWQCGICFHSGEGDEFRPRTASADRSAPECPRCLNNDADSFSRTRAFTTRSRAGHTKW